ncbi:MAG: 1,4-alpha-glucan branching protein GlgB, partial [Clostridia bacterium]
DFMYLVDCLHQAGIAVILDWVPSHFPDDPHGLGRFDGTHLYEHADPRRGVHPDWHSLIFNYGRHEVRSFLLSSALFWLDQYHVDGLRVDAVASMLYLDYSRKAGEWLPNREGGRENLDAIQFLQRLNREVYGRYPGVQTYAEESTAWPGVSRPTDGGGLGFGYKWDMGWMHDALQFLARDPIHRRYHYDALTFRSVYAWSENFVLPLSHDEVVYGKGSLLSRMPGDPWQQRANLRLLLALQATMPGKKLLFMGGEWGQAEEWAHEGQLHWGETEDLGHRGILGLVAELNRLVTAEPALHELDVSPQGFQWVEAHAPDETLYAFLRFGHGDAPPLLVAVNATPEPRTEVLLRVPEGGPWDEIVNTDAACYGGSNIGNLGCREARFDRAQALLPVTFPPLAAVILRPRREPGRDR